MKSERKVNFSKVASPLCDSSNLCTDSSGVSSTLGVVSRFHRVCRLYSAKRKNCAV